MKRIIKRLSTKFKVKSLLLSSLAVAGAYLVSLVPVYLGKTLDGITNGSTNIVPLIGMFTLLFLSAEVINIIRRVSVDRVSARFEEELRNKSIRKLLHLPIRELSANGVSGELTSKINQAVGGSSQLLNMLPNDLLPAVFTGLFVVVQCLSQAPLVIAAVMLGYIVCTLSVSIFQIRSQRGIREDIIRKKAQLDGDICQSIAGIEQIRSLGAESAESIRLSPHITEIRKAESKHHTIMGLFDVCKHTIKTGSFVGILFMGLYLIEQGNMTSGAVIAVVLLFQQLIKPLDEWYRFLDEISACSIKADMLNDIMSQEQDSAFEIEDVEKSYDETGIVIDHYEVLSPGEDKVLSRSNKVVFQTDTSTALVAKTGGGKSSLMKGLIRLYPLKGAVKFFGVDLSKVSQETLVRLVHYVPQSPFFFAGTIRDNLAYGLPIKPTDDELIGSLSKACLLEELQSLSKSSATLLDYKVKENGKNFSGGQLKRLAIARAFLRSPKLYMFDETFANIDEQTISAILTNIESYAKHIGAGIIHISHEQGIVNRCSNTIKLEPVHQNDSNFTQTPTIRPIAS